MYKVGLVSNLPAEGSLFGPSHKLPTKGALCDMAYTELNTIDTSSQLQDRLTAHCNTVTSLLVGYLV